MNMECVVHLMFSYKHYYYKYIILYYIISEGKEVLQIDLGNILHNAADRIHYTLNWFLRTGLKMSNYESPCKAERQSKPTKHGCAK